VAEVTSHRRYCYLRYRWAYRNDDEIWFSWDARRQQLPGTALPASFPARATLTAAGVLALEEIQGADESELLLTGLSSSQAAAVLAALG